MTSRYKEHMKELKGPDQFQVKAMSILDWAIKNVKLIAAVVVPILLIAAASLIYQYVQQKHQEARVEDLGKVEVVYMGEQRKAADARQALAKKIEAIDAQLAKSKDPKTAATVDLAKLTAEKDQLTRQAESIEADHSQSVGLFQAFFEKNTTNAEGWAAGTTAARALIDEHKLPEARKLLETVLAKSKTNAFYQTQARFVLIGVLEEQGAFDEGLKQVDTLAKLVGQDLQPRVMLAKGRLEMLKNANTDARKTFNSLIESHATSPEAQKARALLALLH